MLTAINTEVAEDSFLLKSEEYQMFIAENKQVMRLSELWNNSQPRLLASEKYFSRLPSVTVSLERQKDILGNSSMNPTYLFINK